MAEIKVPELAESITEGTVAQWLKKTGEYVEKGDYIVELETDKVNVEIISEESGIIQELKANEGDTVQVGETIAIVNAEGAAEEPQTAEEKKVEKVEPETPSAEEPKEQKEELVNKQHPIASPAARRLARERGIDLQQVKHDVNQ